MRLSGRLFRGLLWTLFALLLLLLAGVVWLRAVSNPLTQGRLSVRGLSGPVQVIRDQWGVPHIRAATDLAAMQALGFVHAQDRLWQMEFQRRIAQGRLSEVLGAAALPQDKFLRTWGFYRAAQNALPALSPHSRRLISAYTAGVNAGIGQGRLPPEFRLLGFRPAPWTDVDSVAWSKLMAFDLGGNWEEELLGARAVKRLGVTGPVQLMPTYPAGGPTIVQASELPTAQTAQHSQPAPVLTPVVAAVPAELTRQLSATLAAARRLGFASSLSTPGKGSNDWVVAGRRTATGKPILADDPHLALSAPMLWYLADVQGGALHAIGATIPGLPGIVIGRNDRVAWGVTNVNPDVQDLYLEPAGAVYRTRTEVIRVKGQPDVTLTVRETGHGPVVADGAQAGGQRTQAIALRWTALQAGDTTFDSFLNLNYARNWPEFTAALKSYVAPSQNFVYADVDGNTGYYAPGRVPLRLGWDGRLPVSGDGRFEWQGYIPFAELPHVYNPADGLVVTANNKVLPGGADRLGNLSNWAEPYRAARILQLIDLDRKLSVDDVASAQLDTRSLVWADLKSLLLNTEPQDEEARTLLGRLRAWDGEESLTSTEASIFETWLTALQGLAQDELGDGTRLNALAVKRALSSESPLCRNVAEQIRSCAELLGHTYAAALGQLRTALGRNPDQWQWQRLHAAVSRHGALGTVAALGWLWNRSISTPGGTNTVNVARPEPGTWDQTHGPSYRQIIDLSAMNASRYIGTLGQGGNPLGSHYSDLQARWQRGDYLPMSTDARDWGRTEVLTLAGN